MAFDSRPLYWRAIHRLSVLLYSFTAKTRLVSTNGDGASPAGRLLSYGAALYGTTPVGDLFFRLLKPLTTPPD